MTRTSLSLKTLASATLLAALSAGLGGCGIKGGLDRPPPMWGEDRAEYEAQQAHQAEGAAEEQHGEAAEETPLEGDDAESEAAPQ